MAQYRKKPVVIEAFQLLPGHLAPPWFVVAMNHGEIDLCFDHADITTLEGTMRADNGDWIIRGIKNELYPCKPDIFEATYELVEEICETTNETQDIGNTSDGYHTFNELYQHRHALFLCLMLLESEDYFGNPTWVDLDPQMPDWFLAGIDYPHGQVSYHLPMPLLPIAKQYIRKGYKRMPYDGYTAADVLLRLQRLAGITEE